MRIERIHELKCNGKEEWIKVKKTGKDNKRVAEGREREEENREGRGKGKV
jgi:hypothetical protein